MEGRHDAPTAMYLSKQGIVRKLVKRYGPNIGFSQLNSCIPVGVVLGEYCQTRSGDH